MSVDKKATGLYDKFRVERTDGTSAPGGKHDGCEYFVLDLTHDEFAMPALRAYADACRVEYPVLSADLDAKARCACGEAIERRHSCYFNSEPPR